MTFALSSGTFTQSGGNTATGSGTGTISIAAADLASAVTIDNSIAAGGTNNVTFSGSGSLSTQNFSVAITDPDAVRTIRFIGGFDVTAGNTLSVTTTRDLLVDGGSDLTGGTGVLTLSANQQTTPTAENFLGVTVQAGAVVTASGTGTVTVLGRGGSAIGGLPTRTGLAPS